MHHFFDYVKKPKRKHFIKSFNQKKHTSDIRDGVVYFERKELWGVCQCEHGDIGITKQFTF